MAEQQDTTGFCKWKERLFWLIIGVIASAIPALIVQVSIIGGMRAELKSLTTSIGNIKQAVEALKNDSAGVKSDVEGVSRQVRNNSGRVTHLANVLDDKVVPKLSELSERSRALEVAVGGVIIEQSLTPLRRQPSPKQQE